MDESTGALFSVDSFGALLPEPTESPDTVPPEALAGGMAGWAMADSPWAHLVDRQLFAGVLDKVRALASSRIYSAHLPAASGASLEQFLGVLQSVPDAEPLPAPGPEEFAQMLAALAAGPAPPAAAN